MLKIKLIKAYGFIHFAKILLSTISAKLFVSFKIRKLNTGSQFLNKNLIHWQVGFSGGKDIRIEVVNKTVCPGDLIFDSLGQKIHKPSLTLGKNITINDYCHIGCAERISIGNDVLIGSSVIIIDHNHGSYSGTFHSDPESTPVSRPLYTKPIIIEDNVWIGDNVTVLPGTKIGFGSIIGANSVVSGTIEEKCVAAGSPAKIIKKYNPETKKWEKNPDLK